MTALVTASPAARGGGRRVRPLTLVAAVTLVLLVVLALVPGLFAPHSPTSADPGRTLLGPSGAHPLGTDQNGRDVLSRLVFGARPTLLGGLGASALALVAGTALGVAAARGGRFADQVVTRGLDVLMAVPGLLLALLVITVVGPGAGGVVVAVAITSLPVYARLVRAEVMRIGRSGYVTGAVVLGRSPGGIVLRHMLPNALGPVLAMATVGVGGAIGMGATLSFLGLGPQPPAPEWGAMLADSRDYFAVAWWTAVSPGVAITGTVLAVTVFGRHLRLRAEGRLPR